MPKPSLGEQAHKLIVRWFGQGGHNGCEAELHAALSATWDAALEEAAGKAKREIEFLKGEIERLKIENTWLRGGPPYQGHDHKENEE